MTELALFWQQTWRKLGITTDKTALLQQLLIEYTQSTRKYHNQQHLSECFQHFDAVQHLAKHPEEIALALWFHDAVYRIGRQDNKQQSAQWAEKSLIQESVAPEIISRIKKLILVTCHDATPEQPDEQLMVDIDLAILGSTPQRFVEYETQIRQEYHLVPNWLFRYKRKKILHQFLKRPRIYATDHFYLLLEQQARTNLEQTLKTL